ncbi:MAG: hypothetical protein LBB91_02960 [Clostridiales bacterium]|jgi:hypothetical protein|nr:hypothetical protein [Clostridiales bacterium]
MKSKRKIFIPIIVIIALLICLIPIKTNRNAQGEVVTHIEDGEGTVVYSALIYKVIIWNDLHLKRPFVSTFNPQPEIDFYIFPFNFWPKKWSSESANTIRPETLDEAMKIYLREIEADRYSKGDYFAASYRILDVVDLHENGITVYAHTLGEWVNMDGEFVSGGAGVVGVTFRKVNGIYERVKFDSYDFPEKSETVPQKVKDALLDDSYFENMRTEVEQEIADFLQSNK